MLPFKHRNSLGKQFSDTVLNRDYSTSVNFNKTRTKLIRDTTCTLMYPNFTTVVKTLSRKIPNSCLKKQNASKVLNEINNNDLKIYPRETTCPGKGDSLGLYHLPDWSHCLFFFFFFLKSDLLKLSLASCYRVITFYKSLVLPIVNIHYTDYRARRTQRPQIYIISAREYLWSWLHDVSIKYKNNNTTYYPWSV